MGISCHELCEHVRSRRNPLVAICEGDRTDVAEHLRRSRGGARAVLLLLRSHHPRWQDGQLHHGIPGLQYCYHLPLHRHWGDYKRHQDALKINLNLIISPSWLEAFLDSSSSYPRASLTGMFIKLIQSGKSLHLGNPILVFWMAQISSHLSLYNV